MDTAPQPIKGTPPKSTPLDVFLWLGALISLYGSVTAIITLLFEYINWTYPDPLAYNPDAYSGSIRFAMASLIVLAPIGIFLLRTIRLGIMRNPAKANIWIRRWALIFTIFVAAAMGAVDLITLINTFLGGEVTTRFMLKVAVVLLVSLFVGAHYVADIRGYWVAHPRRAALIGAKAGVLAVLVVVTGFFVIGSPNQMRLMRFDDQKVSDLQGIQYQIVDYWQTKQALPKTLDAVNDPLNGYTIPTDPQSGAPYEYTITGPHAFTLCATFNRESKNTQGQGAYPTNVSAPSYPGMPANESWQHGAGKGCFDRTIDPERYPPYPQAYPTKGL